MDRCSYSPHLDAHQPLPHHTSLIRGKCQDHHCPPKYERSTFPKRRCHAWVRVPFPGASAHGNGRGVRGNVRWHVCAIFRIGLQNGNPCGSAVESRWWMSPRRTGVVVAHVLCRMTASSPRARCTAREAAPAATWHGTRITLVTRLTLSRRCVSDTRPRPSQRGDNTRRIEAWRSAGTFMYCTHVATARTARIVSQGSGSSPDPLTACCPSALIVTEPGLSIDVRTPVRAQFGRQAGEADPAVLDFSLVPKMKGAGARLVTTHRLDPQDPVAVCRSTRDYQTKIKASPSSGCHY